MDPKNVPPYNAFMQNPGITDPTPGTFNNPTKAPDYGGNTPAASKPITVPSTGNDYNGWNWEQVLVGALGLQLPNRNDLVQQQWTAMNFNSPGGTGMYRIYAVTWGANKDVFVYLNPNLLQPGGAMDNYIYQPKTAIYNAVVSANYTGFQNYDPQSFTTATEAIVGITSFYENTNNTFKGLSDAVAGDKSAFKGQAGEAFAQLMNNLYQITNSAYTQIAITNNYTQRMTDAGTQANAFLTSLWGGIVNWWAMVDHNPLGAIYQALLDGGVIGGPVGGPYQLINPTSVNSSFGDLRTEEAWQAIEQSAKNLWLASIQSALDPIAQSAINALTTSYLNTASSVQPLTPPTLTAINPGSAASANPNLNNIPGDPNPQLGNLTDAPGGANPNLNVPGGANNPMSALGNGGANPNLNLPGGANTPMSALANPGNGGNLNLPGGVNTPMSALANPGNGGNLNLPGGANAPSGVLAGLGGPGGIPGTGIPGGVSSPQLLTLRTALGNNRATQSALQQALSLAPATGPLHNALETALANNGKARAALQGALGGTIPAATALQNALASNGQAQSALRQALALAPAKGPLHNALQTALNDSNKTQSSLNQSLTNGSIPGTSAIHQALHSDNALTGALHKALTSAQVPSHGPLHDALTNALAQSGHVKSALDQALAGGATPDTPALNHALSSNTALQAELRHALSQAPAHGALHNELTAALADSKNIGTQIHQALAQGGVLAEPPPGMLSAGVANPTTGLGSLFGPLAKNGLTASLGGVPGGGGAGGGISAALGGGGGGLPGGAGLPGGGGGLPGGAGIGLPAHGGAAAGLTGTPGLGTGGAPASSGRFAPPSAAGPASGNGTSAVPFFPPMAGGGGMAGAGQQQQERERTTWLAEDEDVWGTGPKLGPAVLGRDFLDDEEEFESDDEFDEPAPQPARDPSRIRAR